MPLDLKKDDMGDVIKDFYKSKAPQFKGKSKKKRREMAIAAKLSAERGPLPEAAPTNSTGDGVANYIPYLFKNEDDDNLTQDYQTPAEPGEAKFRFSNVYPVLKLTLSNSQGDGPSIDQMTHASKEYTQLMDDNTLKRIRDNMKRFQTEESNPRIPRKKGQPANSKKHSDLYTDENPKGTIHGLGFKDVATAKASVSKIRNSSRSHAHKIQAAVAMEQRAREMGKTSEAAVYRKYINAMKEKTKRMNEAWSDKYKKSIDCNNPKGFSQRAHCQGRKKKVNETAYFKSDSKYQKKIADAEKRNKEKDKRMKFGKFYDKAKAAKDRLRPGEVRRYDKTLGRYVSNKE